MLDKIRLIYFSRAIVPVAKLMAPSVHVQTPAKRSIPIRNDVCVIAVSDIAYNVDVIFNIYITRKMTF